MSIGQYNIIKPLGKGTYGETYLVEKDGTQYAIKYFKGEHERALKDFTEEKKLLQAISAICREYSACYIDEIINDQGVFIVMTFLSGISLKDAIFDANLKIPYQQRININICRDLILGLNAIHSLGLAHQDIKLDNLIYNVENGKIKYIDFGISCLLNDDINVNGQPIFGFKFPCGSPGTPITSPPEMFAYGSNGNNLFLHLYDNGVRRQVPKMDTGIYPTKYLIGHDIWSVGCVLAAWYTDPQELGEMFYALNVFQKTLDELEYLKNVNATAYYIIYGLLNRNVDLRIQNFENIIPEYTNILPTEIVLSPPNLTNKFITKQQIFQLRQWRCRVRRPLLQQLDFIPAAELNHMIGENKNSCLSIGVGITVIIQDSLNEQKSVEINTMETISMLKYKADEQNLYLNGQSLDNNKYLIEYDIKDGDVLTTF